MNAQPSWSSHDEPLPEALATLQRRAREYEVSALIKALCLRGIPFESIRFEGSQQLEYKRGPIVRELRFEPGTPPLAIVAMDAGLLSLNAPLPEYFRDFARRLPNPDPFLQFMGFWDSVLLRNLAYCSLVGKVTGETRAAAHGQLARVQLDSPMTLHWMFRSVFPELTVSVEHATFRRPQTTPRLRVGAPMNGRMVLGGSYSEAVAGFRVCLSVEGAQYEGVRNWEDECSQRLERFDDLLLRMRRPLEVVLQLDSYCHGLSSSAEPRQLGVRPWLLREPGQTFGPGVVRVRTPWSVVEQSSARAAFLGMELHPEDLAAHNPEGEVQRPR